MSHMCIRNLSREQLEKNVEILDTKLGYKVQKNFSSALRKMNRRKASQRQAGKERDLKQNKLQSCRQVTKAPGQKTAWYVG